MGFHKFQFSTSSLTSICTPQNFSEIPKNTVKKMKKNEKMFYFFVLRLKIFLFFTELRSKLCYLILFTVIHTWRKRQLQKADKDNDMSS